MAMSNILFLLVLIIMVAALVIWIATITARAKRMSAASDARLAWQLQDIADNPPTAKPLAHKSPADDPEPVVAMAPDDSASAGPAADRTKEDRLTEIDALRATGAISDDELAAARAKILAE